MLSLVRRFHSPRGDRAITYLDPLSAGRHPFQVFILALCLLSGLPILVGQYTAGSVEETLNAGIAYAWGASLVFGSATALVGSFLPRASYGTAVIMERVGLQVTGYAALIYATIIALQGNLGGVLATGIVGAFGAACLARARDIGRVLHRAETIDHTLAAQTVETQAETTARVQDEAS